MMASRHGYGQGGQPSSSSLPPRVTSRAASTTSSRARSAAADQLAPHLARRPPQSTAASSDSAALRRPRFAPSVASTAMAHHRGAATRAASEAETETDVDEHDEHANADGDDADTDLADTEVEMEDAHSNASSESILINQAAWREERAMLNRLKREELAEQAAKDEEEEDYALARERGKSPPSEGDIARAKAEKKRKAARRALIPEWRAHKDRQEELAEKGESSRFCHELCQFCKRPDVAEAELRRALQESLDEKVRSLDDDAWMFEPENDDLTPH